MKVKAPCGCNMHDDGWIDHWIGCPKVDENQ